MKEGGAAIIAVRKQTKGKRNDIADSAANMGHHCEGSCRVERQTRHPQHKNALRGMSLRVRVKLHVGKPMKWRAILSCIFFSAVMQKHHGSSEGACAAEMRRSLRLGSCNLGHAHGVTDSGAALTSKPARQ